MPDTLTRAPRPSSLADVLDLILDKGLVIDAYVRVSLAGIELLTIDARIVVASVDTYLRFAEAVNRLDLTQTESGGLPEVLQDMRGEEGNGDGRGRQERNGDDSRSAQRRSAPALSRSSKSSDEGSSDEGSDDEGSVLSRLVERAKFD